MIGNIFHVDEAITEILFAETLFEQSRALQPLAQFFRSRKVPVLVECKSTMTKIITKNLLIPLDANTDFVNDVIVRAYTTAIQNNHKRPITMLFNNTHVRINEKPYLSIGFITTIPKPSFFNEEEEAEGSTL
jgi:hypothetical protein